MSLNCLGVLEVLDSLMLEVKESGAGLLRKVGGSKVGVVLVNPLVP